MDLSQGRAPTVPVTVGSRPDVRVSSAAAPARAVTVAPSGSVPAAWVAIPASSGAALLEFAATVVQVAVAETVGAAALGVSASSQTEALGGYMESTGPASLSLSAAVAQVAVAETVGAASLPLSASSVSEGTLKAASMGMRKSGDQSPIIGLSVWTTLTTFTADPTYPDTVLTGGNTLVSHGPGSVTVNAAVAWSGGTGDKDIRVLVNGTVVWTKGPSNFGASVQSGSFVQQIAAGDAVTLQAWSNGSSDARRSIQASGTALDFIV